MGGLSLPFFVSPTAFLVSHCLSSSLPLPSFSGFSMPFFFFPTAFLRFSHCLLSVVSHCLPSLFLTALLRFFPLPFFVVPLPRLHDAHCSRRSCFSCSCWALFCSSCSSSPPASPSTSSSCLLPPDQTLLVEGVRIRLHRGRNGLRDADSGATPPLPRVLPKPLHMTLDLPRVSTAPSLPKTPPLPA